MNAPDGLNNVEHIIDRFGGMRPMARKMDIAVSTIQGWKKRDHIPSERVDDVMKAAKAHNVPLQSLGLSATSNANENMQADAAPATQPNPVQPHQKTQTTPTPRPAETVTPPQTATLHSSSTLPQRVSPAIDLSQIRRDTTRRSVITTLVVIGVLGGTGYVLFGNDVQKAVTVAQDQQQTDQRLSILSEKFGSFETTVTEGLNSLSGRVTDIAAAVGVERNQNGEIVLNNNMSLSERMAALESRLRTAGQEIDLGQLMTRFETLNDTVSGRGEMDAAMADLRTVVTALRGRVDQLDTALEQAKQDNDALARSLENVNGRDLSAAAMLLALTQFRTAMNRSEPFAEDLDVLRDLVGDGDPALTAAIDRLAPHAADGVLTPEGLSKELRAISGDIIMAKLQGEDVSITDKILTRLGQILSIEKDGKPVMATREQEIIATAQQALDKGDVQTALATLNQLDGSAATAAQTFKQQMQGTLAAQTTTEMLMRKFLEKMQQPNGIQGMVQDLPQQLRNITQGTVKQDAASGIIILE